MSKVTFSPGEHAIVIDDECPQLHRQEVVVRGQNPKNTAEAIVAFAGKEWIVHNVRLRETRNGKVRRLTRELVQQTLARRFSEADPEVSALTDDESIGRSVVMAANSLLEHFENSLGSVIAG